MTDVQPRSRFKIAATVIVIVALVSVGILKFAQAHALKTEAKLRKAEVEAGPRVRILTVGSDAGARVMQFQGEALPYASTTLYAKVSGFLKEIRVDKGSPVRQGEVLAVLESAEVDRDTQALRADAENKKRDAERSRELGKQGILSSRDVDAAESASKIAGEKLASQRVVQGYKQVLAPFSGVVTARFVDPGALIQNGGTTNTAQPIVSLAQVDRLRVTFYLDQRSAPLAKAGLDVEVRPADHPEKSRRAKISRVAGTLDPRTRTLLVEAELDNHDQTFLGGGFVQVFLKLPDTQKRMDIPSEALLIVGEKIFAAVLGNDSRVHLQPLVLGDDTGGRVQVVQGLSAGDRIVMNPSPALKEGDRVQVMEPRP